MASLIYTRVGVGALIGAVSLLLSTGVGPVHASDAAVESALDRVVVAPLMNLTGQTEATRSVLFTLYSELDELGVPYLKESELRPALRKHRIRTSVLLRAEDAAKIQEETGGSHLLIGTVNRFDPDNGPEASVTFRLLRLSDMRIVSAAEASGAGLDFAKIFGIGRVFDVIELSERLTREAIVDLIEGATRIEVIPASPPVAIVPFDNVSRGRHAGTIVTNLLLTELLRQGFQVVEPGLVAGLFQDLRVAPVGEIDRDTVKQLHEELGIAGLITGAVDRFDPARSSAELSVPNFDFTLRILDAETGHPLAAYTASRSGRDGEVAFGLGRCHSVTRLARQELADAVHWIGKERRSWSPQSN